jgi:hypothetical protein
MEIHETLLCWKILHRRYLVAKENFELELARKDEIRDDPEDYVDEVKDSKKDSYKKAVNKLNKARKSLETLEDKFLSGEKINR